MKKNLKYCLNLQREGNYNVWHHAYSIIHIHVSCGLGPSFYSTETPLSFSAKAQRLIETELTIVNYKAKQDLNAQYQTFLNVGVYACNKECNGMSNDSQYLLLMGSAVSPLLLQAT